MTELSAHRAPFLSYFYWGIFLGFAVGVSLFLHRMIQLTADEELAYGVTTLSSYQAQASDHQKMRQIEQDLDL